jgi:hypothetical protein
VPASNAVRRGTARKRARFLELLALGHSVSKAALLAEVSRAHCLELKARDEAFARAWQEAEDIAADLAEDELHRRAVKGVLEPRFYQGVKCGSVRKYSDRLLLRLLEARRPKKWREGVTVDPGEGGWAATIALLEAGRKRAEEARAEAEAGLPIRPIADDPAS